MGRPPDCVDGMLKEGRRRSCRTCATRLCRRNVKERVAGLSWPWRTGLRGSEMLFVGNGLVSYLCTAGLGTAAEASVQCRLTHNQQNTSTYGDGLRKRHNHIHRRVSHSCYRQRQAAAARVRLQNTASASRSPLQPVPPSVGTTVALLVGATTKALIVDIEASIAPRSCR